jgi:hypothetical protein
MSSIELKRTNQMKEGKKWKLKVKKAFSLMRIVRHVSDLTGTSNNATRNHSTASLEIVIL